MRQPASVDSKPFTQYLSPLDVTLTENQGGCRQPELGSPWQRPNRKRHKHLPSHWLKPSQIHSILRYRVFHEGVPHKLRALVFPHQGGNPQIDSDHILVVPAGQGIEGVHITVTLPSLRIAPADPSQHVNGVRKIKRQRACRRTRHDTAIDASNRRSLRRRTSPRNVTLFGVRGADSPKVRTVIRELPGERKAEQPVRLCCRDRVLEIVREGVLLAPEIEPRV